MIRMLLTDKNTCITVFIQNMNFRKRINTYDLQCPERPGGPVRVSPEVQCVRGERNQKGRRGCLCILTRYRGNSGSNVFDLK